MGIETEYGISVPTEPTLTAMQASGLVVNAYAQEHLPAAHRRARWDYLPETPLRDARGFDMSRADADPSQLTDEDLSTANVILANGARLYVDHAHPEYSAPECLTPREATLHDRAGMMVMAEAAVLASRTPGIPPILLYKNNTDNKGASYGCHENYLMSRTTPFADVVRHFTTFLVTRQVFTGAGRLGKGQEGRVLEYQISQRADFFETEVGLETTVRRPIINTRDEPHADPEKSRRLHVITGDANLSDTATLLKLGSASLVLGMIESGFLREHEMTLDDPVMEMHRVSHDPTLAHQVRLLDGRRMTALDLQSLYLERAVAWVGDSADHDTQEILRLWEFVLATLADDPMNCGGVLDWVAKLRLLEGYRTRDALEWDSPALQLIDLQYSDVRGDKGLARRLEERGRLARLFSDDDVASAMEYPPESTRAYFRGECVRRYPEQIAAASWDSVVFDLPDHDQLLRVPTLDPLRGTKAHVSALFQGDPALSTLLSALAHDEG
ncbi:MAG: depupylase/deamidase Dop [Actinomycetes bacterium]|jgi:proteasome accessory factor A